MSCRVFQLLWKLVLTNLYTWLEYFTLGWNISQLAGIFLSWLEYFTLGWNISLLAGRFHSLLEYFTFGWKISLLAGIFHSWLFYCWLEYFSDESCKVVDGLLLASNTFFFDWSELPKIILVQLKNYCFGFIFSCISHCMFSMLAVSECPHLHAGRLILYQCSIWLQRQKEFESCTKSVCSEFPCVLLAS